MIRHPEVRRASPDAVTRASLQLERSLGPSKATTALSVRERYACDESIVMPSLPDVVVFAADAADIAETLRIAQDAGVPVTPRAGGTSRVGGAVPVAGGIVLVTSTLGQIKAIDRDNHVAVVEPGVITGELHRCVEAEGLFYPPDPNSLASCMVGGNVAANAGGPRALKYGSTRDYVLGTSVHLMGGRSLHTGRRTPKGVSGYDVTSLLVGSEGTLGVFSEITLALLPKPPQSATLLALFGDVRAATLAVIAVMSAGIVPSCAELMDAPTLAALRAQRLGFREDAGALVLFELDGAEVEGQMLRVGELLSAHPGCLDVQVAQGAARRDALWAARRILSPATRALAKYKLSEDVVVPRTHMPELLDRVGEQAAATGVRTLTYGHAGDGNLHVNFLWDHDHEREGVDRAIDHLMRATVALGGTLSGEHGIGVTKLDYLPLEHSPGLLQLQNELKRVFDPDGLLNPGKVLATSRHQGC